MFSFLAGNRNIIRLPGGRTEAMEILCAAFARLTADHPNEAVRRNTAMVTYGHEREITAAISARCDLRVIWGGDRTVEAIRGIPLPPYARELTFADGASLSALCADA